MAWDRRLLGVVAAALAAGCGTPPPDEGPVPVAYPPPGVPTASEWLSAHPAVAEAVRWQVAPPFFVGGLGAPPDAATRSWAQWTDRQRAELDVAAAEAAWWIAGDTAAFEAAVPDPMVNVYFWRAPGATAAQTASGPDMWRLYTALVGWSVAVEIAQATPWRLEDYGPEDLRYLLDSRTMAWRTLDGDFAFGTSFARVPALRRDNLPETAFGSPAVAASWWRSAGGAGAARLEAIATVLEWFRANGTHFLGAGNFEAMESVWQYAGYPPLSRVLEGTTDVRYPEMGHRNWTAGCHGTVGVIAALLRSVNVPVQPIWVGGHELAFFPTEGLYLDHGDDPYSSYVRASSAPILNVLIDESTYAARFTPDPTINLPNPGATVMANIGLAAAQFQ